MPLKNRRVLVALCIGVTLSGAHGVAVAQDQSRQPAKQVGSAELNLLFERYEATGDDFELVVLIILDPEQHSQARAAALRALLQSDVEGTRERLFAELASFIRGGLDSAEPNDRETFALSHSSIALATAMYIAHSWDELTDSERAGGMGFFDAAIRDSTEDWFGPSIPTAIVRSILDYQEDPAMRSRLAFASVNSFNALNDWMIYRAGKSAHAAERQAALAELRDQSARRTLAPTQVRKWLIFAAGIRTTNAHHELSLASERLVRSSRGINVDERAWKASDALHRMALRFTAVTDPASLPSDAWSAITSQAEPPSAIEVDVLLERGLAVSTARAGLLKCEAKLREQVRLDLARESGGQRVAEEIVVSVVDSKIQLLRSVIDDFE